MIKVKGAYTSAKVFATNVEAGALAQIEELCNQEFALNSKIRIMPDVHSGKGCVIGLTMTYDKKIVSNLVGVDIGCGITGVKLQEKELDFEKLESTIKKQIPAGFNIRKKPHPLAANFETDLMKLKCAKHVGIQRALSSLGTLGGGNHFIEVGRDSQGYLWLFVHSGSRNIGNQVAQYYQKLAMDQQVERHSTYQAKKQALIATLKEAGRGKEITAEVKKLQRDCMNPDLAYLEGRAMADYIHDVEIMQNYAKLNREVMVEEIMKHLNLQAEKMISVHHNYVDVEHKIVRKGAISAQKDEVVFIPLNMRDGMIIGSGKGHPDWNYSAPHGAGRVLSRSKAMKSLSIDEFKETMKDVWSKSVVMKTLDESPMAYKPMNDIIDHIDDTVEMIDIIKPIYNFKAT